MKKITKLVCVAMALVILVCSTNGATASAAKRIYFAGEYRCKLGPGEYYVLQLNQYSSPDIMAQLSRQKFDIFIMN